MGGDGLSSILESPIGSKTLRQCSPFARVSGEAGRSVRAELVEALILKGDHALVVKGLPQNNRG